MHNLTYEQGKRKKSERPAQPCPARRLDNSDASKFNRTKYQIFLRFNRKNFRVMVPTNSRGLDARGLDDNSVPILRTIRSTPEQSWRPLPSVEGWSSPTRKITTHHKRAKHHVDKAGAIKYKLVQTKILHGSNHEATSHQAWYDWSIALAALDQRPGARHHLRVPILLITSTRSVLKTSSATLQPSSTHSSKIRLPLLRLSS